MSCVSATPTEKACALSLSDLSSVPRLLQLTCVGVDMGLERLVVS